jgi:hypothetical protein
MNDEKIIQLAKLAIAWERPHGVYFPSSALEMAELGSQILIDWDIFFWISPFGDSITCVKCRNTSRNPHDVENRYCGSCKLFLEHASA